MDSRFRALREAKPPKTMVIGTQHHLLSIIYYPLSTISLAQVPLPSGGAGRQALVGNAWHAPLPLLLQTPFAKAPALYLFLLAAIVALAVFRHLRRVAAMAEGNREEGIGKRNETNGGVKFHNGLMS